MPEIIVIAHNIRSTHNVGALFRTCDGLGVSRLVLSGYTPFPRVEHDPRLPHNARKITEQIHKTALGAELSVPFDHTDAPDIAHFRAAGYQVIALEQDARSVALPSFQPAEKVVLLLGEEVHGVPVAHLEQCDVIVEIPMQGVKESFNVSVAAGIALYHLSLSGVQ